MNAGVIGVLVPFIRSLMYALLYIIYFFSGWRPLEDSAYIMLGLAFELLLPCGIIAFIAASRKRSAHDREFLEFLIGALGLLFVVFGFLTSTTLHAFLRWVRYDRF